MQIMVSPDDAQNIHAQTLRMGCVNVAHKESCRDAQKFRRKYSIETDETYFAILMSKENVHASTWPSTTMYCRRRLKYHMWLLTEVAPVPILAEQKLAGTTYQTVFTAWH